MAVASFIEFCTNHNISQPPDKIVKNLCTFLCQDVEKTPTFAYMRKFTDGILSFQDSHRQSNGGKIVNKDQDKAEVPQAEELKKTNISRRGARLAFDQLSAKFGPRLLTVLPNMWQSMTGGLFSAFQYGMSS